MTQASGQKTINRFVTVIGKCQVAHSAFWWPLTNHRPHSLASCWQDLSIHRTRGNELSLARPGSPGVHQRFPEQLNARGIAKQHYHVAQLICLIEKREQLRLLNRLGVTAVLLSDILAGPSLAR